MFIDAIHTVSLLGHRTRRKKVEIRSRWANGRHQHKQQLQSLEMKKSIAHSRNKGPQRWSLVYEVQDEGREEDRPRSCGALYAVVRCWYFLLCPMGSLWKVWMRDRIRFSHF